MAKQPRECLCGCGQMTKGGRFCPGHDARLKSRLHKEAAAGNTASHDQLVELGWVTVPDQPKQPAIPKQADDSPPVKVGGEFCPQPVPKRNGRKPKKPPADIPPAVQVYREMVERYPPKPWWDYLDRVIGREEKDLVRWGEVVFHYIGCGWNNTNVNNMLRFYLNNELPGSSYGQNGEQPASNGKKRREVVTV